MKLPREPGAVPRSVTVAVAVLVISLLVGTGFAVAAAISSTFASSLLYQVLVWLPRIGFVVSATLLLAYEPYDRRRIRRFVERSGWTAEQAVEPDFAAVRSGATLLSRAVGELGDFPEELRVNACLERDGGSVRVAIPAPPGRRIGFPRPAGPDLAVGYVWVELPAKLPAVVIARRSMIGRRISGIDHRALDERFVFDPPGRAGRLTGGKESPRERPYDAHLRELFGPATDILMTAPAAVSRLGIVDHRLFALTSVDATAIEGAADLLLRLRAAMPDDVLRRYRSTL